MNRTRLAAACAAAASLGATPDARAQGTASAAADPAPCARCLEAALPALIDSARVPGIAAAVIRDGRVVWSGGAGVRDVETRRPVTARTVFRGASLGKPIFACAVLKLVDAGRLALDTPLVRYVPAGYLERRYLRGPMADTLLPRVTARMVLSHTSGLPNWRPAGEPVRVHFAPGTRYSYSGEGYLLLQRVVEHVTGQPVERFVQATVLRPLGMTRTSYAAASAGDDDVATAYGADAAVARPPADEEPNVAHTVRTTAADYARFLAAVLAGEGLRPATRRAMLTAQTPTDVCRSGEVSRGLGFAVERPVGGAPDSVAAFVQWGRSPDATGYVLGLPARNAAVVYLTNVAVRGLQVGAPVVKLAVGHDDKLLGCFGVRPVVVGR